VIDQLVERDRQGRLAVPVAELAKSFIHMHANRCLRSAPRAHELVLYDFLDRCYASQIARARPPRAAAGTGHPRVQRGEPVAVLP
jgi:class I lanthipeptide synthase